jgi:hypothetical protein
MSFSLNRDENGKSAYQINGRVYVNCSLIAQKLDRKTDKLLRTIKEQSLSLVQIAPIAIRQIPHIWSNISKVLCNNMVTMTLWHLAILQCFFGTPLAY